VGARQLDNEDTDFIRVFTEAIGSIYYKDHLLKTTIENSQFQSFNIVVSFIIHDIKNQIATLSLMAQNADRYMDNPDFRKSLVSSIRSSSKNLTILVEKLSQRRKGIELSQKTDTVLPILERVISSPIVTSAEGISVEWVTRESCEALIDVTAFEQVLINIVKNAVEAMDRTGTLRLMCASGENVHSTVLKRFNLADSLLQSASVVVVVEDSGAGMSMEFMEQRLFRPFETTKDKGIGIGLYQSKTYVEKMNGKLLCDSIPGKGTAFCIIILR
jgi:signal transduction histidine kinase